MVLIGIWGNAKSGKTTLANYLFREFNVKTINVDETFIAFNKQFPKLFEKVHMYNDVIITNLLKNLEYEYYGLYLKYLINKYKNEDYDYFIIEGFDIGKYISINDIDINIYVDCPFEIRKREIDDLNSKHLIYEDLLELYDISEFDFIFDGYKNDYQNRVIKLEMNILKKLRNKNLVREKNNYES